MKQSVRYLIAVAIFVAFANVAVAQNKEEKFFKKENLFTGGSLTLSFFNGATVLGATPHFGYSLNKFIDVAALVNFNYASQRDYLVTNDKLRQTIVGPGAFVRIFPVNFIYAQAQFEQNFIKWKYIPAANSGYSLETKKVNGSSMLVGGGYCTGREPGNNSYGYFSIMWDVGNSQYSPYKDGQNRAIPIVKGGINIALFQGSIKR